MRKLRILVICLAALLISACRGETEPALEDGDFALYFREAELENASGGDALRAAYIQIEDAENKTTEELAEILLLQLLQGPTEETLVSLIPKGTSLLSVTVDDGQAQVDLSTPYNMLSGVELTLADYAITMTLNQLPEVLTTTITVHGQKLAYRDRQTFSAWDVLHATEEDVLSTLTATLYFPDENGVLQEDVQTLDLYEGDTQVKIVADALKDGPEQEALLPVMPATWKNLSVWVKETTCYVNLPTALLTGDITEGQVQLALEALGRSLCGLDTVGDVRFLVDGAFAAQYGTVDVSAAYTE